MYFFIILVIIFAVPPAIMIVQMRRGSGSPYQQVMISALSVWLLILAVLAAASLSGSDMFLRIDGFIEKQVRTGLNNPYIDIVPGVAEMNDAERNETVTAAYEGLARRVPSYMMIISVIISYFEYIILSKIFYRRQNTVKMPPYKEFALPRNAIMGMFLIYFVSWIISLDESESGLGIYANINVIFDFTFCLQGIAVIFMFINIKRLPKILAPAGTVLIMLGSLGRSILVIFGMLDLIIDLRSRMENNANIRR